MGGWAFISYSHRDRQWADWLHVQLETYRIPKRLVGTAGRDATVPARVFPVFRDREELAGAASLGDEIEQALRQSRSLIVILLAGRRGVALGGRRDRILQGDGARVARAEPDCRRRAGRLRGREHG